MDQLSEHDKQLRSSLIASARQIAAKAIAETDDPALKQVYAERLKSYEKAHAYHDG